MTPFDRSHTSFYSPFIATMAISSIVCKIWRLIGRKSRNFYTPPVFSAPAGSDPVGISWKCLMLVKQKELIGLPYGEKNCDDMLSRFYMILERNGQTDRQTDRFAISISRVSMLTRLTRDKNQLHAIRFSFGKPLFELQGFYQKLKK